MSSKFPKPQRKTKNNNGTFASKSPFVNNISEVAATPDAVRVKLRYTKYQNLLSASVIYAGEAFRLNSPFQPSAAGGGPAMGFDQWATLYKNYRCLGAKMTNTATSNITTAPLAIVTVPKNNATIDTTVVTVASETRAKVGVSVNSKPLKQTITVSTREFFGLSEAQFGEPNYQADVAADPAILLYGHVIGYTTGGSFLTSGYSLLTEIEYDVQFFNRVELEATFWADALLFEKAVTNFPNEKGVLQKPILNLELLKKDFQLSLNSGPDPSTVEGAKVMRFLL